MNQKDKVVNLAVLFKNIGEQEEGMKLYTQFIMQGKTLKQLDQVIQNMFLKDNHDNVSEHFA